MVRRYERRTDAPDDCTFDIFYIDRLTGQEVMRYDGADPANTNPAYGACSDDEAMANRGYDLCEEVDVSKCVVRIPTGEPLRWAAEKARSADRKREEEEAQDLLEVLGDEAEAFDFSKWADGEQAILKPALEKLGYTNVGFYMAEQDSFGPLMRGCVARDTSGKRVRFFYG